MIIFELVCDGGHRFEGWFRNSDEFSSQLSGGMIACPVCDSRDVHKLPTGHVSTGGHHRAAEVAEIPDSNSRVRDALERLRHYVEQNFEDVGDQFADEARRIHYGETEPRDIRGEATQVEVEELKEEGIEPVAIPVRIVKKLN